ncbi:DUF1479 domain-containing protein, partial [Klebsiella pneumoniae]|nr:DUF1479 domain-containing protein [Klebsiella pneumoniae]
IAFKRSLAGRRAELKRAFDEAKAAIGKAAEAVAKDNAAGRQVIPEIAYADIKAGKVSDATRQAVRKTGCAVVRGVFPASQA